ncbi:MAG: metallophosphatase [Calothrix sp. C42_A2020_038]|nr:metallophosphatase [Calothrix sp. C42_A2020_038]
MKWAILSGVEGNLTAYEAVLQDIRRQRYVEALYIIGDLIGPTKESEHLVQRVRKPRRGELQPLVCKGWWEEQCLILHAVTGNGEPTELIERYGKETVQQLWEYVPRQTVHWLSRLDFGFFELDCLLIHGSTVSVSEELTSETCPIQMLDRVMRMQANTLFCGRSGLNFEYEITNGSVTCAVKTLDTQTSSHTVNTHPRKIVGVGNVGRVPGQATYTIYNSNTNHIDFKTVYYGNNKGFERF